MQQTKWQIHEYGAWLPTRDKQTDKKKLSASQTHTHTHSKRFQYTNDEPNSTSRQSGKKRRNNKNSNNNKTYNEQNTAHKSLNN